jgi:hypothetical protein
MGKGMNVMTAFHNRPLYRGRLYACCLTASALLFPACRPANDSTSTTNINGYVFAREPTVRNIDTTSDLYTISRIINGSESLLITAFIVSNGKVVSLMQTPLERVRHKLRHGPTTEVSRQAIHITLFSDKSLTVDNRPATYDDIDTILGDRQAEIWIDVCLPIDYDFFRDIVQMLLSSAGDGLRFLPREYCGIENTDLYRLYSKPERRQGQPESAEEDSIQGYPLHDRNSQGIFFVNADFTKIEISV